MELFQPLEKALEEQQYETPTPIQAKTIPLAVDGQDILGCAQTGTGKTAAFALPILDYIGHEKPKAYPHKPVALVLAPTRELAVQISDGFRTYGKHMKFSQALVYGGVSQKGQVKSLSRGVHLLVATPGRLIDLMDQGHISLGNIDIFVLDEADRMMDMGFMPALKKIIAKLPSKRQSLFFSATMPPKIRELAKELLFNPAFVDVTPKKTSVKKIDQHIRLIARTNKITALQKLAKSKQVDSMIVFTRTKRGANVVAQKLDRAGITAQAIHGNKSQNARQRALNAFKDKSIRVLVATDVAARGIDIDGVSHVVNYDMPVEAESYVHRVGRTGRAGAAGVAISFCTPDEFDELRAIEKFIGSKLRIENPDNVTENTTKTPAKQSRGQQSKRGRRPSGKPGSKSPNARRSKSANTKRIRRRKKKSTA